MAQLRGAVRALAPVGPPAQVLENLDTFARALPAAGMATVAYVELEPATGAARYACAGHPPPLVVGADGSTRFLWEGRSTPLGSHLGSVRVDAADVLRPGDTVVLYTDGLVERRTESLEAGLRRLDRVARGAHALPVADLVEHLLDTLLVDTPHEDDACVLALRLVPEREGFVRTFPASPSELAPLRHAFGEWLDGVGADAESRYGAVLAVSEAAANAIEHGYERADGATVVVEAQCADDGRVRVAVRDRGGWREPVDGSDRGRGIAIMRALAYSVSVEPSARGTVVRMELPSRSGVPA
jgi:anti-sigma regulatory factor (Ser/Thr protein kinase)